jgi:hypothetical protein
MTCWAVSAAPEAVALCDAEALGAADEVVDVPCGELLFDEQAEASSITAGTIEAASKPVNRQATWSPSLRTCVVVYLAG